MKSSFFVFFRKVMEMVMGMVRGLELVRMLLPYGAQQYQAFSLFKSGEVSPPMSGARPRSCSCLALWRQSLALVRREEAFLQHFCWAASRYVSQGSSFLVKRKTNEVPSSSLASSAGDLKRIERSLDRIEANEEDLMTVHVMIIDANKWEDLGCR